MGMIDIAVFVGFVALVMTVGLWKSKSSHSEEGGAADYFLAGRGLKWWLIGVSLIAANISAEQFVGMSGQAASELGLAIASYEWMAAVSLVVTAFVFLPYFLRTGIFTIPGFLEHRYNKAARSIMALFSMIILIGVSLTGVIYAGGLLMCDLMLGVGFKVSLPVCCWVMGGLAAAYVAAGGLKACAWADLIQGIALILGGALITYFTFEALGKADVASLTAGVSATGDAVKGTVTADMGAVSRFWALNAHKMHMLLPKANKVIPWTALCLGLWIPNIYYWGLNQYITQRTLGASSVAEGQKGIVFAAALKLIIPFIIVVPGLIAFNLFSGEMAKRGEADFVRSFEADAAAEVLPLNAYEASPAFAEARPDVAARMAAHNVKVAARAAELGKEKGVTVKRSGYKTDTALGLLVSKLCMDKRGLFGFIVAALLGAIVSSLAAVLNAASTIFSMDFYNEYIKKNADPKALVVVGRVCVGVFVAVGCLVAPRLDDPRFGGIFTYIQEFQGYVSPGVLAVFVYGLLNRRSAGVVGVVGLLFAPVLYGVLALTSEIDFLNRMAVCLAADLIVMTALGLVFTREKPVEFRTATHLDLRPSRGAAIGGIGVVVVTLILYAVFN